MKMKKNLIRKINQNKANSSRQSKALANAIHGNHKNTLPEERHILQNFTQVGNVHG